MASILRGKIDLLYREAICFLFAIIMMAACKNARQANEKKNPGTDTTVFAAPDTSTIPHDEFGEMVRYGRELIVNTAMYIGPNGKAGYYAANKMSCGSCHLDAGTRPFGYSFISTHAHYPQYRGRENEVLNVGERINNCIERPLNGFPLPLNSKEIIAMECYIKWLSQNVPVGQHVKGDKEAELEIPEKAADPEKGAEIFAANCASCHGKEGQGMWNADSSGYTYPPLWGNNSFQKGSSPSRVLKLAAFIKTNMPYKIASWQKPFLTDEQSIDVAAFINDDRIHPRPTKRNKTIVDYPDMKTKAIDYDTGPFQDSFSAMQHKFGPYKPIISYYKAHNLKVIY